MTRAEIKGTVMLSSNGLSLTSISMPSIITAASDARAAWYHGMNIDAANPAIINPPNAASRYLLLLNGWGIFPYLPSNGGIVSTIVNMSIAATEMSFLNIINVKKTPKKKYRAPLPGNFFKSFGLSNLFKNQCIIGICFLLLIVDMMKPIIIIKNMINPVNIPL